MKKQLLSVMLVIMILLTALSVQTVASEPLKLIVSSETAGAGEEVKVTISVANNTGLASLKFDVAYDSVLTLAGVAFNSEFGSMATAPEPFKNPEPLTMISPLTDVTANGIFATLTFIVADEVPDGYKADITVSYEEDDIYDGEYENVSTTVTNGSVTVTSEVDFPATVHNNGANIRFETADVVAGLRFGATLTKEMLGIEGKYKYEEDGDMTFGMLLLPKYLLEASAYDTLSEYFMSGTATNALNIVAKKIWAQDDDYITYTAVVTNIPEAKWGLELVSVPYMLKDGEYYFAEADKMQKSYYGVAKEAREGEYADSKIAAITDPDKKAEAQVIAEKLQDIIDVIDKQKV